MTNSKHSLAEVVVSAELAAWQGVPKHYPALPTNSITSEAGKIRKVEVRGVPWTLGPASYWWPNIPYRSDYRPQLHWLHLTLSERGKAIDSYRQRFGFVEYAEGPSYYTVNGVRFTSIGDSNSYGQVGEYDCWSQTPCFLENIRRDVPRRGGVISGSGSIRCGCRPAYPPLICSIRLTRPATC